MLPSRSGFSSELISSSRRRIDRPAHAGIVNARKRCRFRASWFVKKAKIEKKQREGPIRLAAFLFTTISIAQHRLSRNENSVPEEEHLPGTKAFIPEQRNVYFDNNTGLCLDSRPS